MNENLINETRQALNQAQAVYDRLNISAEANNRLLQNLEQTLFKINNLESRIQAYQVKADILG